MILVRFGPIMRKRQKFVLTAVLIALGILLAQFAPLEWRYLIILLLAGVSWLMSAWCLREGLGGIEWLTVLLPQALFTLGVGLFYILLPDNLLARILIAFIFAIGHYALILSGNIFSVATIRTIALLRSAQAVGLVMSLLTGFLLFNTFVSFRFAFWWTAPLIMLVSFAISLCNLWSIEVGEKLESKLLVFSLFIAIFTGVLSVAISFWPVNPTTTSLFLTSMLYCFLGLSQHHISQRLFRNTVWEYVAVGGVVLITVLVTSLI